MTGTTRGRRSGNDSLEAALHLIARGTVSSRTELAHHLRISPSTASLVVKALLEDELIVEVGAGESRGGRRPTLLRAVLPEGTIAVAELGGRHMRIGLTDLAGSLLVSDEVESSIADGPRSLVDTLCDQWSKLRTKVGVEPPLAATVAVPGPVNALTGEVVGPTRMPAWHGSLPADILHEALGIPAHVENDARAAALGEYVARREVDSSLLYVKAGSGIGAGYIHDGHIHVGSRGVAGDIAHVKVTGDSAVRCACGRIGCLEAVASGAAINRELEAQGISTSSMRELVSLGQALNLQVSTAVRASGTHLGRALAPLVNFLNPQTIVVGGALSGLDSFVAAVRSSLYDSCLPMCSQDLSIEAATAGADAALRGLGQLGRQLIHPADLSRSSHA